MRRLGALAAGVGLAVAIAGCGVIGQATPGTAAAPHPAAVVASPAAGDTPFRPVAVAFWDARHGIVGGTGPQGTGMVALTDDGGRIWGSLLLGAGAITELDVAGTQDAWAAVTCPQGAAAGSCRSGLLHSGDGGLSWMLISRLPLAALSFGDPVNGWSLPVGAVVADLPTFLSVTSDGGNSWRSVGSPCRLVHQEPQALSFVAARTGWIACTAAVATGQQSKAILSSADGGSSWETMAVATPAASGHPPAAASPGAGGLSLAGSVGGLSMRADGSGWLWTGGPSLLATKDQGRKWTAVKLPGEIISAWSLGAGNGVVLTRDAKSSAAVLSSTADAGKAWVELIRWPPPAAS